MLGGAFSSTRSRENVVLHTKFLSNDLPYFTELLAEVASQSKFAREYLAGRGGINNCIWNGG